MTEQKDARLEEYQRKAEPIRAAINNRPLTDFVQLERSRKGKGFICPVCRSGEGPHGTGALMITKSPYRGKGFRTTCFSGGCFGDGNKNQGTDTFGALRILWPTLSEVEIFRACGYDMNQGETASGKGQTMNQQKQQTGNQNQGGGQDRQQQGPNLIEKYHAAIDDSIGESYLNARGINRESIDRFMIGYNAEHNSVIFPHDAAGAYYTERLIHPGPNQQPHYKPAGQEVRLYNAGCWKGRNNAIYIVESPICAISIMQEGGPGVAAVALAGRNEGLLIDLIEKEPPQTTVFLCLDNDETGQKITKKLIEVLNGAGVAFYDVSGVLCGDCKDPNETLEKFGADSFRERLQRVTGKLLQDRFETETQAAATRTVDRFLNRIKGRTYEPIPTGFSDLDRILGGGFFRQQLITLGGAPGVGKTAFSQNLFENMVLKGDRACIFVNLEMSQDQLLARSVSRIIKGDGYDMKPLETLQGYSWTEEQEQHVLQALAYYEQAILPGMLYPEPAERGTDINSIMTYLEGKAQYYQAMKKPVPLIVIDYLQAVSKQRGEDTDEAIKNQLLALKDFAVRYDTVCFVIIAQNRDSNKTGKVSVTSGRDTSNIEYSGDVMLGLTFAACVDEQGNRKSPDSLTREEKQNQILKVLKGRFVGDGDTVGLYYDGASARYTQRTREQVDGKTGYSVVNVPVPFEQQTALDF